MKILTFLLSLLTLISCSVSTPFYIQNKTQNNVEVKIHYNNKLEDLTNYGDYKIIYQNGILTPKQFEKSNKILEIEQIILNDSTVLINIPKNSTVRIARTSNTYFVNHIKTISYNDKILSINEVLQNSKSKNWKIIYQIQ